MDAHTGTTAAPAVLPDTSAAWRTLGGLLAHADIRIGGERPWDLQVHDPAMAARVLAQGSLGLGESYMDGAWDVPQLDVFFERILAARLDEKVSAGLVWQVFKARLFNRQSRRRAFKVGQAHYDLGNDFFVAMLGPTMAYSCGYWRNPDGQPAADLDTAQRNKLELICRKLGLEPGMRLLDIGCGWGSLMRVAAERGVHCTGLTVSAEQGAHVRQTLAQLPVNVEVEVADYRSFNADGRQRFDRIASVGMFEHVGRRNYPAYFDMVRRCLADDGLFLLHSIGRNHTRGGVDPWIDRYIFPNGELPAISDVARHAETRFVIEDVHDFGADYDPTLMAWHANFQTAWPRFAEQYGERFARMWRYYLLACAGAFRARTLQLWQFVLSPHGVAGGYRRPE